MTDAGPTRSARQPTAADDADRAVLERVAAGELHALVVVTGLSPASGDRVYEAWVIAGSNPKPIGSFTVGSAGTGFLVATAAGGHAGDTVALTLEPGPGATAPTLPIVVAGIAGS
jgi:Anti-sigma-K factor rskA